MEIRTIARTQNAETEMPCAKCRSRSSARRAFRDSARAELEHYEEERQQADILTTIHRLPPRPHRRRAALVRPFHAMRGRRGVHVAWDDITLQDEVERRGRAVRRAEDRAEKKNLRDDVMRIPKRERRSAAAGRVRRTWS
jgi:hypothetical protein